MGPPGTTPCAPGWGTCGPDGSSEAEGGCGPAAGDRASRDPAGKGVPKGVAAATGEGLAVVRVVVEATVAVEGPLPRLVASEVWV